MINVTYGVGEWTNGRNPPASSANRLQPNAPAVAREDRGSVHAHHVRHGVVAKKAERETSNLFGKQMLSSNVYY